LNEDEEGVLAVALLQPASSAAAAAKPAEPSALGPAPLAASAPLGVTAAIYRASSLRTPAEGAAPAAPAVDLPAAAAARVDALAMIAARRSRRRYAPDPVTPAALGEVLAAMGGRVAPLLSPAVRVNLVANAVEGLRAGAWRYDPVRHALVPRRVPQDLRRAARAAALDQDVIGDAAVVFVLSIARAVFAADPDGAARGYRHAFIEAGLVGERVYLAAQALGLDACAVGAFYDDEAAALVGLDPAREWVVHFAALGVPAR
jgi:SagB-type dehydrogenase family enzyme